jgi:hypothetical protein
MHLSFDLTISCIEIYLENNQIAIQTHPFKNHNCEIMNIIDVSNNTDWLK